MDVPSATIAMRYNPGEYDPKRSDKDPNKAGPKNAPMLPVTLIAAMLAAAATPVKKDEGKVQKGATEPK